MREDISAYTNPNRNIGINGKNTERTLFRAVTIAEASLENILTALKNFPQYRADKLERGILEVFIPGDTLYRGKDKMGNAVELFQVQYTQDLEKVGRRTYRLSYCLHFSEGSGAQQRHLRVDVQQVRIAQTEPQELERAKARYGEEAGVEFVSLYGSFLFLPIDGTEQDTVYCLVHYLDANPRKRGENGRFGRGVKRKVVRTNVGDLKMRAETIKSAKNR